jgi:hypothetical protein
MKGVHYDIAQTASHDHRYCQNRLFHVDLSCIGTRNKCVFKSVIVSCCVLMHRITFDAINCNNNINPILECTMGTKTVCHLGCNHSDVLSHKCTGIRFWELLAKH